MRRALLASAISLLLVVGSLALTSAQGFWGADAKDWRIIGFYDWYTSDSGGDALGDGFAVEVERALTQTDVGSAAGFIGYRRHEKDVGGFGNELNHYSIGLKLRNGPGASPSMDGFYYGGGLGLAILDSTIGGSSDTEVAFEWRALAGINFARSWFGEINYVDPGDAQGASINSLSFGLGYRF